MRSTKPTGRNVARALDAATDNALVASRVLVSVAAKSLASIESQITLRQYRALVVLAAGGPQNLRGLAHHLEVHSSTATRLCDRLLVHGLIERTPSAESRREVDVRLSSAGEKIVQTVSARRRREIRRIMGRLSPAEQHKVVDAFELFGQAAAEPPDEAWKLGWQLT